MKLWKKPYMIEDCNFKTSTQKGWTIYCQIGNNIQCSWWTSPQHGYCGDAQYLRERGYTMITTTKRMEKFKELWLEMWNNEDERDEVIRMDMWDKNEEKRIELGQKVRIINGQVGKVVYECGAFGVAVNECINYKKIQEAMDSDVECCGNRYQGCFNDNFISLWELYWNSNSVDDTCRFVEILQ